MRKTYFLMPSLFCLITIHCFSQKEIKYTPGESSCIGLFNDFTNYIIDCIQKKHDLNDPARLKYILVHYLFINTKLDTLDQTSLHELDSNQLNSFKKELNAFYRFFQERENKKLAENVTALPIRMSPDKSIYNKLTAFQKNNTFIFYDKRFPGKVLGYMLFIPPIKNKISAPRIWSWTLLFKFGKFIFKSVTGEEGYEYMFSPEKFKH